LIESVNNNATSNDLLSNLYFINNNIDAKNAQNIFASENSINTTNTLKNLNMSNNFEIFNDGNKISNNNMSYYNQHPDDAIKLYNEINQGLDELSIMNSNKMIKNGTNGSGFNLNQNQFKKGIDSSNSQKMHSLPLSNLSKFNKVNQASTNPTQPMNNVFISNNDNDLNELKDFKNTNFMSINNDKSFKDNKNQINQIPGGFPILTNMNNKLTGGNQSNFHIQDGFSGFTSQPQGVQMQNHGQISGFNQSPFINQNTVKIPQMNYGNMSSEYNSPDVNQFQKNFPRNNFIQGNNFNGGMINNQNSNPTKMMKFPNSNQQETESQGKGETDIVSQCKEQYGCRRIQKILEESPSAGSNVYFPQIKRNLKEIITNQFGNYLLQKLIPTLQPQDISDFIYLISPDIKNLCNNQFGTRVIQKLIDELSNQDLKYQFIGSFPQNVILSIILNAQGNHVMSKLLTKLKGEELNHFHTTFLNNTEEITKDKFGCCVVQKMIESCSPNFRESLISNIMNNIDKYMHDPYANYVLQLSITYNYKHLNNKVLEYSKTNFVFFGLEKFSSNVIEKALSYTDESVRNEIIDLISDDEEIITKLLLDLYGNHILQKALLFSSDKNKEKILRVIKTQFNNLDAMPHGRKLKQKLQSTYLYFNFGENNSDFTNLEESLLMKKSPPKKAKKSKKKILKNDNPQEEIIMNQMNQQILQQKVNPQQLNDIDFLLKNYCLQCSKQLSFCHCYGPNQNQNTNKINIQNFNFINNNNNDLKGINKQNQMMFGKNPSQSNLTQKAPIKTPGSNANNNDNAEFLEFLQYYYNNKQGGIIPENKLDLNNQINQMNQMNQINIKNRMGGNFIEGGMNYGGFDGNYQQQNDGYFYQQNKQQIKPQIQYMGDQQFRNPQMNQFNYMGQGQNEMFNTNSEMNMNNMNYMDNNDFYYGNSGGNEYYGGMNTQNISNMPNHPNNINFNFQNQQNNNILQMKKPIYQHQQQYDMRNNEFHQPQSQYNYSNINQINQMNQNYNYNYLPNNQ